jgi:hypothetical protein
MNRSLLCCLSAITLAWAGPALGDPPTLHGQYGFTGAGTCLWAPGSSSNATNPTPGTALPNSGFCNGLNEPVAGCTVQGHPIDGKVFSTTFAVEGVRTFRRDGTGTVTGSELSLDVPPTPQAPGYPAFPPSADTDTFTYDFTYTVDGHGGWTATVVPGTFKVQHVLGGRAGQTSTVANFPKMIGTIGDDAKVLTIATADPNALTTETVTFSNGDVWPRICHRSRVLEALRPDDGNH